MVFKKIDTYNVPNDKIVRVKQMGNITELMYSEKSNSTCKIKKIDKDTYVDLRTGELREFEHNETRACDLNYVRQSLTKLRDYINTNLVNTENCKWITLTYADNMTDTNQLYTDFKKFIMRAKYKLGHFEYIVAMEPQGRGAWHAHMLMVFDKKAPYISNNEVLQPLWRQGFTKTKAIKDIDNVGAYLTAYMSDMELSEASDQGIVKGNQEVIEKTVNGKSKKFVKGARMVLYPVGFNLYRCSRGIKKPVISHEYEKEAKKKVSTQMLTFEKTIRLADEGSGFCNTINYRQYNKIRK